MKQNLIAHTTQMSEVWCQEWDLIAKSFKILLISNKVAKRQDTLKYFKSNSAISARKNAEKKKPKN